MRDFMNKNSVFYLQREVWDDIKEYKENFKEVIKQRERNRIPFFHQSPQYPYRQHLVEYIKRVCMEKKLSYCCLHLCVYLLDIFMDNHSIIPERVLIIANVCLLIAAKFEESNMTIPKIADLNAAINNRYTLKEYQDLELIVLKFFHWYIMFPTAAHYTHYYMQAIITNEEVKDREGGVRALVYNLHEAVTEYLDQIINNIHYMQCYPPSKLAAAILAASRLEVGLSSWNEQLENLTDYKKEDIHEVLFILMVK
ncbi:hypothetical protein NQ317_002737 [Molorchus minor]|uniref:Cyclin-like domain-containing protein n=1 Tax=Molorchus minor TaxID=1323400 RepID=A0ABQ9K490_9CUCU|nr:hypothetical protein NQ317_002737 [Molorchus minor]